MSRIDKYLWHARLYKSRTMAAEAVSNGRVRINGDHCAKPAAAVKPGDVLTVTAGSHVRIIKVVAYGVRRGPASEARQLYEDLTPAAPPRDEVADDQTPNPMRKPTSRERKAITQLRNKHFDA